jgi:hypothetical protein
VDLEVNLEKSVIFSGTVMDYNMYFLGSFQGVRISSNNTRISVHVQK